MRTRWLALLSTALVAGTWVTPVAALPQIPAHPEAARAHETLDRARAALGTQRLSDAVSIAAELGGHPVEAISDPPLLAVGHTSLPGGVRRLAAALAVAAGASERAILEPTAARTLARRLFRRLDLARMPEARGAVLPEIPGARFVPPSAGERARDDLQHLLSNVDSLVDLDLMYSGAAHLAGAIDAALPELRRYAPPVTAGARSAAPCDLFRSPEVCLSSEASQTYEQTDDVPLIVDLGGNDVYRNSAAGCIAPVLQGTRYAAAVVDVAGNDRYEVVTSGPVPNVSGPPVQGSCFGGVGMLVDAAGDDSYSSTNSAPGPRVHAQGMALIGVGLLADLGGSDSYSMDDPTVELPAFEEWATAGSSGQGLGAIGMGLAIDQGQGDDRYSIVSTPQEPMVDKDGWLQPAQVGVSGFGVGALGGVGLHYDGGGKDSQVATARSAPVAPDDARPLRAPWAVVGAWAESIFGGVGILVSGDGPTDRIGRAESIAPVVQLANVYAMASGGFAAYSGLYDAGGDDRYIIEAVARAKAAATLDDSCECSGEAVYAVASPFWSQVITHAAGGLIGGDTGNVLLLQDAGGDDEYVATLDSIAEVDAHDARTQLVPPPEDDPDAIVGVDAIAWAGVSSSRSLGTGFSNGAYAALEDDGGRDTYTSGANNVVDARATAFRDDAMPEATARSDGVRGFSQGYGSNGGLGLLRDTGGGDVYRSSLTDVAVAEPETGLITVPPINWVQGAGDIAGFGLLLDTDGGAVDAFSAVPPIEICSGTYGEAWVFCGTGGGGAGVNA